MSLELRDAVLDDLPIVHELIHPFVEQRRLLPRSIGDLEELLPNAFVAAWEGRVCGFAAVAIYSKKIAEILCLAVAPDAQRHGVGQKLVAACVERAETHGVSEVMAISSAEAFLKSCGFDFALPEEKKAFFYRSK